jgi:hypothetical protein
MKARVKHLIIALCAGLIIVAGALGVVTLQERITAEREAREAMTQEQQEKDKIAKAYQKQNYSVRNAYGLEEDLEREGVYMKLPPPTPDDKNSYGVSYYDYSTLNMYKHRTGNILSYEELLDYFSEEYEPDGTLRLYNNGLHPKMEAYVEWMWGRWDEQKEYVNSLQMIYSTYWAENRDKGFQTQPLYALSPQMLDELARKEADPDYEMDLLSLQQQGY